MNPCPCGWLGHASGKCHCLEAAVLRYQSRISGPLLDRIDIQLPVAALGPESMGARTDGEPSSVIAVRVAQARAVQMARQGWPNSHLGPRDIDRYCAPDDAGGRLLHATAQHLHWSARAYHRVLKVARTVADLAGSEHVAAAHVAEAIGYRRALQRE